MNFLAHSLFGFDDSALIAGQFCGDFVRGRDLSRFPAGIEQGIRLHRHLDVFTDHYPALQDYRHQMHGVPRRFSGIIVDVLFDHYLARNWEQFSERTLEEHAVMVQEALREHEANFPTSLKRFMAALEKHEILQNNQNLSAIEVTLFRISQRSEKFKPLALNQQQLEPLRDSLHEVFMPFYPVLEEAARIYLREHHKRVTIE